MQVGLNAPSATTIPASGRSKVDAPQHAQRLTGTENNVARRTPFPEAALISRRPLRYNVQLNQQLTAVQQADSYLTETESQLLRLRHSTGRSSAPVQAATLRTHLQRRATLSGGTVDRHFGLALQQRSQVRFAMPEMDKLLSSDKGETLIFALGGGKRELAAVTLPDECTPRQAMVQLNTGLGRLGIYARQSEQGPLVFSVDETRWERVSQQLSVRGEGTRFSADAFTLLAPRAEPAREDELLQLTSQGARGQGGNLNRVLDQLTAQRSTLARHHERVASRIQDMATRYTPAQAQQTSQALGMLLANSRENFSALSQALTAQGNLRLATVKNVLG